MPYINDMNILMITNGWPPESLGGVEIYVRRLALELGRSHKVRVFCREADPSRQDYITRSQEDSSVHVTRVNYNFGDLSDFAGTYFIRPMGEVFKNYLAESGRPDVVHVHHLGALGHSLVDVLDKQGVPVVLTQHDFALTCPRGQRIRDDYSICETLSVDSCLECLKPQCQGHRSGASKLYRYLFRKQAGRDFLHDFWTSSEKIANQTRLILSPSGHHAKRLEADGFPGGKILIMPYGYDHEPFQKHHRGKIGLARKFGYLGSLIPSKGVHLLIQAFGLLVKDVPDAPLELHLFGPAPNYHGSSDYPSILKQMASENRVIFHGPYKQDDLPGIMQNLDALVMPSLWWESHGMVIREAKLAGLPVIVSDHGAIGEAITDGVNGLKVRPGDKAHLRDKMKILATTHGLADAIASNPLEIKTILQDAKDHEALYQSLLNSKT